MQIRRSSVTAVLQAMEQDGFITRSSVARDARLKRLNATAKGVAYHERIRLSIARFERELQRGVEPERQAVARGGAGADSGQRAGSGGRGTAAREQGR